MIPLPATLSGVPEMRCVVIDTSLFYIIAGAMLSMLDDSAFEQTGTLTTEDAHAALEVAFYGFIND